MGFVGWMCVALIVAAVLIILFWAVLGRGILDRGGYGGGGGYNPPEQNYIVGQNYNQNALPPPQEFIENQFQQQNNQPIFQNNFGFGDGNDDDDIPINPHLNR
jgi:hypothetical protein